MVQLIWLNKQRNFEQKTFTNNIIKSIREVYIDVPLTIDVKTKLGENIERIDDNNFIFRVDLLINKDTLINSILLELENFDVFTDCKVAYYDQHKKSYVYEVYLPAAASIHPSNSGIDLVPADRKFSYIHLFFPHRSSYILQGLWLWILLSILLLIALLALSTSLFYLYKQKFLIEIQKDFINNVTHEFQTPITTLQLGLEVLSNPDIINHPVKIAKYTSILLSQTEYLKHHIENLMLVIRADAHILSFKKEDTIINNLVHNAVHQLSFFANEKEIHFEYNLEESNQVIQADRNNMLLVIVNLISNAIKYSKDPYIIISTFIEKGVYVFSIKDNGIGIADEYKKNLFKKFYRVPHGNLHDTKGLGLGLYFVKKIMEMHNGRVEVSSVLNQGSEFRIIIPIV
ncbi:MAG: HAMP domain-containing sensor histidine kinase [Bacteroidetes bacterium]|nr:HAMP domain-containing sensor histidine kinase [Bacteroidota bacterium]